MKVKEATGQTPTKPGDEEPTNSDNGLNTVIYTKSMPIILEVKTSVLHPHEFIELVIYCMYIMRQHQRKVTLGGLTDGKTWEIL